MATIGVTQSEISDHRTAMEKFGSGGRALLPWTKQILIGLWEQLCLLVQVIYYSFMSVFQMFRFEVHLRITDETGQHVQHMSTATNPTESFLFSSLFDGESGVMVGGSNPLSNFCAEVGDPFAGGSTAEALLSSLRADDLCCGLVDDFVSRTTGTEDGIFIGNHPSWKMGFPGDWNFFVSGCEGTSVDDTYCKDAKQDTSEEEKSTHWSSEEDQTLVEFDSALWESLSRSSDPYNPLFFSACTSTNTTNMGKTMKETRDSSSDPEGVLPSDEVQGPHGLKFWFSRSDSESSWGSSEGSQCVELDREESESLWEFFSSPADPYNPMCFTACKVTNPDPQTAKELPPSPPKGTQLAPIPSIPSSKLVASEKKKSSVSPSLSEDEEEQLWRSLSQNNDPYHPLNFQACLHTSPATILSPELYVGGHPDKHPTQSASSLDKQCKEERASPTKSTATKPVLLERPRKTHQHRDTTLVPWRRPGQTSGYSAGERQDSKTRTTHKKVRFSNVVEVHVMRTWPFAREASRKGHWEEMARDRDRHRRRIKETEQAIGYCFSQSHREKIRSYLDSTTK